MEAQVPGQGLEQGHFGHSRTRELALFLLKETSVVVGQGLMTANQDRLGPRRRQDKKKGTKASPSPPAPFPSHYYRLPTTIHCEAEPCPGCGSWGPAYLASGIKAPEEHGHSHHEQCIEVDNTGPAWVLTDVLQSPGYCSHLLLCRQLVAACLTPTYSTEPEQALVE